MSVPLPLLASSIPPGSKALAALLDAAGGELTERYATIDRALGGKGSTQATKRKVSALRAAGWAEVRKTPGGLSTIRLLRFKSDLRLENDPGSGLSATPGGVKKRPLAGGEGGGCSNSPLTSEPSADFNADLDRLRNEAFRSHPPGGGEQIELVQDAITEGAFSSAQIDAEADRPQGAESEHDDDQIRRSAGDNGRGTPRPGTQRGVPIERGSAFDGPLGSCGFQRQGEQRSGGGSDPSPDISEPGAIPDPGKPKRRKRAAPPGWATAPELEAMTQVHAVLWEAKRAAGMAVAGKPTRPSPANVGPHKGNPGFLGRWREFQQDHLDSDVTASHNSTDLLAAVIRAKVESQAARTDSPKHRSGGHANSKAICGDAYWAANLDAGLAYLQRDVKPAKSETELPAEIDGKPLDDAEARIWREWRPSSLTEADKRVRWHRLEAAQ